ncbi:hypothetical protein EIK77_008423 [Talaromyces pinophilus]|nr:hypothetical protein EIK77_008423 [Talaromyces pinophilus]
MSQHRTYTVGWICALATEHVAAKTFLDEEYEPESVLQNDGNSYTLGRIGEHNVVIALLPNGEYGTSSAASAARDMMHGFPDIRIGMMVGIGGGVPSEKNDIRLGDVVVSAPHNRNCGVFQYDFGKAVQNQAFQPTSSLNQPPRFQLTAVSRLISQYEIDGPNLDEKVNYVLRMNRRLQKKYSRPDPSSDRLYPSTIVHPDGGSSCATACGTALISRPERTYEADNPAIHYGIVASGNSLIKDALIPDRLSAEEDILCFEMEAAGLVNHFPCIVFRGICDYSDSHKNKEWQGYAAMTAAAYAKDLLCRIAPTEIKEQKKIIDTLSSLHEVAQENRDIAKEQLQCQKDLVKEMLSKEEQQCHQLFRLTTNSRDATYEWYKDRVEERVKDTCLWFLEHEHFQGWLNQVSGPLLVTADPGCGKSVLTKYLIDHALPRSATICYYFFKDQDQNTVRQALCAVLHQLFSQKLSLIRHAMQQLREDGAGLINSTRSLWKVLKNAAKDPQAGPLIIVLDALDECAESEFAGLIENIDSQFEDDKLNDDKLKYLLTSRPYEQVVTKFRELFGAFSNIRIPGEEKSEIISEEVNHVITYRINRLSKKKRLSTDLKDYLEQRLRNTTHRTYLWVYLVFDYLERETFKKTLKGVESVVATLPNNVNEAYEQILSKSKKDSMVRKVLSIILAANRPLTLSEMNIAVNVDFNLQSIRDLDLEDKDDFKSRLRSWCGLFVSIHHDKVHFLHQTAREFLLADFPPANSLRDLRWYHSITTRQAHTVLAERCVLYLNLFKPDPDSSKDAKDYLFDHDGHTFLDYSAKNWGTHFWEADDAAIMPFVLRICSPDSKSHSAWFIVYWESRRVGVTSESGGVFWRRSTESAKDLTDLMVASLFGHHRVVDLLLERGANIDHEDGNGWTALAWATEAAHWDVVALLLRAGATVDCKYNVRYEEKQGIGRGSGRYFFKEGHILRQHVHDVDKNTGRGYILVAGEHERTPLSRAAEEGYVAVVKFLIESGKADVNWKDKKGWMPLSWAIEGNHWAAVRQLIRAGAKVHYKYNVSYEAVGEYEATTPLSRAAEKGLELVVAMLLETREAHVDWADEKGWTSLSWAVERSWGGVVVLLLKAGATVNFEYDVYGQQVVDHNCHAGTAYRERVYRRTPLSRAAEKGAGLVVKLLIESGKADVDCEDEKGWTPLSWSIEGGNWTTAKELVKAGANIHHRYEVSENHAMHTYTPMLRAKDKGPEDVVDFFLEMSHSPHVMGSRTLNISQKAGSTPPERYTGIPSANRKRRRS